jgi:hypothetical protein
LITPLELAQALKNNAMVELLLSLGAEEKIEYVEIE